MHNNFGYGQTGASRAGDSQFVNLFGAGFIDLNVTDTQLLVGFGNY